MRIMAIDYGRRRIGIALSDPSGTIAQPFLTIEKRSRKLLLQQLESIIDKNGVTLVLVGNPLSLKGESTPMSLEIAKLIQRLKKNMKIKVLSWDERFTSRLAVRVLKDHNLKPYNVDCIAAALILEDFLASKTKNCGKS